MKALALALLLSSCSQCWYGCPQPAAPLASRSVCLEVPEVARPGALEAIKNWNTALNGKLTLRVSTQACDLLILESPQPPCPDGALACGDKLGGSTIYLRKGDYERRPANIIAHELGHLLGAQHVEGTLMATTGAPQACPDQTTVAQVAAYQHWNLAELRFCSL
jgi:hypothetical protein